VLQERKKETFEAVTKSLNEWRDRECVCECVYVCECVCERERVRVCVLEREREGVCVCVSMYVCVGEREREDLREGKTQLVKTAGKPKGNGERRMTRDKFIQKESWPDM